MLLTNHQTAETANNSHCNRMDIANLFGGKWGMWLMVLKVVLVEGGTGYYDHNVVGGHEF